MKDSCPEWEIIGVPFTTTQLRGFLSKRSWKCGQRWLKNWVKKPWFLRTLWENNVELNYPEKRGLWTGRKRLIGKVNGTLFKWFKGKF